MSEWDGHVYCTCFRRGLTSEPPYPRSDLTVNRFGVVTLIRSSDHSKDPDDLIAWRCGWDGGEEITGPCAHRAMKLVDKIFYFPGCHSHEPSYPRVAELVEGRDFPLLRELFSRGVARDFPSGGIWALAAEATALLEEARQLASYMPDDCADGEKYLMCTLIQLLEASSTTGNPVITHYNGLWDDAW